MIDLISSPKFIRQILYEYGNLLKKVPLNNSVPTLLIFNLLLEYDLNLLIFCLSKSQNIFQLNSYSDHTSVCKMLCL